MARTTASPRPVRIAFLAACLAAVLPLVGVEMVLLPNLRSNPGYLALVIATTALVMLSAGISLSGLRPRLPAPARVGARAAVWGVVAADLAFFLVVPLVTPQRVAHESPVNYATAAASAAPASAPPSAPTAPPAPVALRGAFDARQGPDSVSGSATLGRTQDGHVVLSLTNLNATPGPDLYVFLTTVESPGADAQVKAGIELGKLKATRGDQNYELDPTADYTRYRSAVVYCKSFSVVFGFANLK